MRNIPWKVKEHIGEGTFYNIEGEDKFYSVWDNYGNMICSMIGEKKDAEFIQATSLMIMEFQKLEKIDNSEVDKIIRPILDNLKTL